jgi:hypothetical protein
MFDVEILSLPVFSEKLVTIGGEKSSRKVRGNCMNHDGFARALWWSLREVERKVEAN